MTQWRSKSHHKNNSSPIGRPLKYDEYSVFGQKRHFWSNPNKNFGFLTSEQMEQYSFKIKTEGTYDANARYLTKDHDKFIVNSKNPQEIHCCTCHNNPNRYINSSERCRFCSQHKQSTPKMQSLSIADSSSNILERSRIKQIEKTLEDKIIQVKLPLLNHHNDKYSDKCHACTEKKKQRQQISISNRNIHRTVKRMIARKAESPLKNYIPGNRRRTYEFQ